MHSALVTTQKNLSRNNADEVRSDFRRITRRRRHWRGPKTVTPRIGNVNHNFSRVKYNFCREPPPPLSPPRLTYVVKISSCRSDIWRRRVGLPEIGVIPTAPSSGNDSICRICLRPLRFYRTDMPVSQDTLHDDRAHGTRQDINLSSR